MDSYPHMLGVWRRECDLVDIDQVRRELELICCRLDAENDDMTRLLLWWLSDRSRPGIYPVRFIDLFETA